MIFFHANIKKSSSLYTSRTQKPLKLMFKIHPVFIVERDKNGNTRVTGWRIQHELQAMEATILDVAF